MGITVEKLSSELFDFIERGETLIGELAIFQIEEKWDSDLFGEYKRKYWVISFC